MKKKILVGLGMVGVLIALGGWSMRVAIRDVWSAAQSKRQLPVPQVFSTSTARNLPPTVDPLAGKDPLPRAVNLAVPFLSQAPKQNWNAPYQEACEEASLIMVDAYYRGRIKPFTPNEGDRAIIALTDFSKRLFQGREDTTAEETARIMREFYSYSNVLVRDLKSADDVRRALANGYPVIVPAHGKSLRNPNFHNGGPMYHMLVVKGYTADGRWITNDPGTRNGADYLYSRETLLRAAHDWNGGDVTHGTARFIVVLPR